MENKKYSWTSKYYLYNKILEFQSLFPEFHFNKISEFCRKNNINLIPYTPKNKTCYAISADAFLCNYDNELFIFYNSCVCIGRMKFTIVHEISHIFLRHHILVPNVIFTYQENSKEIWEQQADIFAHNILLPVDLMKELKGVDNHEIARRFNLTPSMVATRKCNLYKDNLFIRKLKNKHKEINFF